MSQYGGDAGGGYDTPVSGSAADMYTGGAPAMDPAATAAALGGFFGYPPNPAGMMLASGGPGEIESELLKRQKELIYAHPLYPLLCVLFEKCELATCTPREPNKDGSSSSQNDVCSSASFKEDVSEFAKSVQDKKPYFVPNPELDTLMLSAIQVLRLHLLELEKVHELCDNFCHRYVVNIKQKMPMEMSGEERASSAQPPSSSTAHSPAGSTQGGPHSSAMPSPGASGGMTTPIGCYPPPYEPQSVPLPETGGMSQPQQQQQIITESHHAPTSSGFLDLSNVNSTCSSIGSNTANSTPNPGGTPDTHLQQHQQQQQHPLGIGGANPQTTAKNGTTPQSAAYSTETTPTSNGNATQRNSSNNAAPTPTHQKTAAVSNSPSGQSTNGDSSAHDSSGGQPHHSISIESISDGEEALSMCGSLPEDGRESVSSEGGTISSGANGGGSASHHPNGKRKVPKVFSKEAITKFRSWLFHNLTHPYPSEEQKKQLAQDTGLTILQVNNWFINARRRIVQPMIDSNNRAGRSPQVNVFKNRRRKNSGSSPSGTPPDNTSTTPLGTYSPENVQMMSAMGANGTNPVYPPAAAMFAANPYTSGMASFPSAFPGFMPGMGAMMNPYMQPGPTGWLDLGAGQLGQMDS